MESDPLRGTEGLKLVSTNLENSGTPPLQNVSLLVILSLFFLSLRPATVPDPAKRLSTRIRNSSPGRKPRRI